MKSAGQTPLTSWISIPEYLQQRGWKPLRHNGRDEMVGLCPLHTETHPSFYVNVRKQVFYCHGCGQGGGLGQLKRLLPEAAVTGFSSSPAALLQHTYSFYEQQLSRYAQAQLYLRRRGIVERKMIWRLRLGYAPGACLRGFLQRIGYSRQAVFECGLTDTHGRDCFFDCLTFPLPQTASLYGRSLRNGVVRHRFLPRPKGGLYGWEPAHHGGAVILVEGLFDLASLWQAGFHNAVAALGLHLNTQQWEELSAASRVYVCFDADENGTGPTAAARLSTRLTQSGIEALRVELPAGHDPNSFFVAGAEPADFQRCLDRARP